MKLSCNKYIHYCVGILVIACTSFACSKMNTPYKEFIKDGAVIYPGKADSLTAYSGNGRVILSWILTDPKVSNFRVYWEQDSLDVTVQKTSGMDTIRVSINNLEEGVYTFNVYSYDEDGHVSVGSETLGNVYGEQYSNTLVNRAVKDMSVVNGQVLVAWSIPDDGTIGEEINYTDRTGNTRRIFVATEDTARIDLLKPGTSFQYRTLYLPDSTAIDTFYSAYQDVTVDAKLFEIELDKSKFSLYELPGDYSQPNGASNTVDNIWTNADEIADGGSYISKVNGHSLPQWFTIDLGEAYKLTRMKLFQRGDEGGNAKRLYAGGNVMEFEVWGSSDPDPDYNPDDHGGDFGSSWMLLQSCVVNRPSGNTVATKSTRSDNTDDDIAAAVAGHEFFFNDDDEVRYIRIKVLKNWDSASRGFVNISSIAFWKE